MITPTSDIQLTYTQSAAAQAVVVDFVKTAQGDFGKVSGSARLVQDVTRIFTEVVGSNPFRPTEGNPMFGQVGRPQTSDMVGLLTGIIEQIESYMVAQQQQAALQGYRTLADMLDSFQNIVITAVAPAGSGQYVASFQVVPRAGAVVVFTTPVLSF